MGREDSDTSDAENMIPDENIPIKDLKAAFKRMNLSTRELVTLSGMHDNSRFLGKAKRQCKQSLLLEKY